jgi:hypothetical protein
VAPGGIVIAVVLLLFPFVVTISTVVLAMLLGSALNRDAVSRHEGSELLETNR